MNQCALLVISLLVTFSSCKIEQVRTEQDFFGAGLSGRHLVVGLFNSEEEPKSEKLIDEALEMFGEDSLFKEHNFRFIKADYKDFKRVVNHYKVQGHVGLFYYIENQLQEFRELGQLADDFWNNKIDKNQFLGKAHEFLLVKQARIAKTLESVEEFDSELEKNKVIAIHFCSHTNKGEENYEKLAHKHIHFHFYRVHRIDLAKKIYEKVAKEKYLGDELVAIVRHKSILDEYDSKEIVSISAKLPYERLRIFYHYESKEKLRNENHGGDVFMDIFHKESKLVIHVFTPDTPEQEIEAFQEAVQRLPKGMFYVSVSNEAKWVGNYIQMFTMAEEKMEPNEIYFIFGLKSKFHISKIVTEKDPDSIEEAVRYTYQKNIEFFNRHERDQWEGNEALELNEEL